MTSTQVTEGAVNMSAEVLEASAGVRKRQKKGVPAGPPVKFAKAPKVWGSRQSCLFAWMWIPYSWCVGTLLPARSQHMIEICIIDPFPKHSNWHRLYTHIHMHTYLHVCTHIHKYMYTYTYQACPTYPTLVAFGFWPGKTHWNFTVANVRNLFKTKGGKPFVMSCKPVLYINLQVHIWQCAGANRL